jgi:hypothetical protein
MSLHGTCPRCGRNVAIVGPPTARRWAVHALPNIRPSKCLLSAHAVSGRDVRAAERAAVAFPPIPDGAGGMATDAYMDWYGR